MIAAGLVPVAAAHAADETGEAAAVVSSASRLSKDADLDFGTIIPNGGGTVTIAPNGSISTTGGVAAAGGAPHPAAFSFDRQIFVDYPAYAGPGAGDSIELINPADPSRPMQLHDFTTDFSFFSYFFQSNYTFHVGGTIDVAADQPPGVYSGTFTVTLDNF